MKRFGFRPWVFRGVFFLLLLALSGLYPSRVMAQNISTQTTTATSTLLNNNPSLGCVTCASVTAATDPFPDTSIPIFQGDPIQGLLPDSIAKGLPADNQFGVGVPAGSSDFPLSISTPFSSGTFINSSNTFSSTPISGGGSNNTITQAINQVTPDGNFAGGDQQFDILFSIQSMTDPDGNLVGAATGTFTQTVDGVTTNGTVQFDTLNGFSGTNLHP